MRLNEGSLRITAERSGAIIEGVLSHKLQKDAFKERWFRLVGNLLFMFKSNTRQITQAEVWGVLLIENCDINMEPFSDRRHAFSIDFKGSNQKHYFSCKNAQECQEWIVTLKQCSYARLKSQFDDLRLRLTQRTRKDPLDDLLPSHMYRAPTHPTSVFYGEPPAPPQQPEPQPAGAQSAFYTSASPAADTLVDLTEPQGSKQQPVPELLLNPSSFQSFAGWETFD